MGNIRKKIFFSFDKLKKNQIKNNLFDIDKKLFVDKELRSASLEKLLNHAVSTTPFYKNYSKARELCEFPVVNKMIFREGLLNFISSKYNINSLVPVVTSGSTGTPFKSYRNQQKKDRNTADTLYFAKLANYELGQKLYYLKIWSVYNHKSHFLRKFQNIVAVDVINIDTNAEKTVREWQQRKGRFSILGYVSALESVAKWVDLKNISLPAKIDSIITMSEKLSKESREFISQKLNANVYGRYSNIENGILAQQVPGSGDSFLINTASYYIEILDVNSDEVLPNNKLGRIVVTDLYNYGMPFIRYDTGDLGVKSVKLINNVECEVLEVIEGRKLDQIFNTKGEVVSSYIVYKNMWQYTEIEQYQLIQESAKEYALKLCLREEFTKENKVINEFKVYLGQDAKISIIYVDEIPLLSSGKRKKVVNLMNEKA